MLVDFAYELTCMIVGARYTEAVDRDLRRVCETSLKGKTVLVSSLIVRSSLLRASRDTHSCGPSSLCSIER